MVNPSKKPSHENSKHAAAKAPAASNLRFGDDTGTGLTTTVSSDFDATDLNPQTCCSNCQTVFEVSLELLSSTDTRVRCGECLSIFDALANLFDMNASEDDVLVDVHGNIIEPGQAIDSVRPSESSKTATRQNTSSLTNATAAALAGLANDTSSLDVTYSDFDLFSSDAGLPEVAFFDQTRDTATFDFDGVVEEERDETFSDTLFARDATVDARPTGARSTEPLSDVSLENDVDYVTDEIAGEGLIFNYQEREVAAPSNTPAESPYDSPSEPTVFTGTDRNITVPPSTASPWVLRSLLFVVFLTLAGGLYGYNQRDAIVNNQNLRPVLELACSFLPCELSVRTDLLALKAVNRTVISHPTLANALIIEFGIANGAQFSQPYPVLEIRLTDRAGRLVVTNSFAPSDYTNSWESGDVLDVGKRLDVALTVEDPGNTAVSFELDFRKLQE